MPYTPTWNMPQTTVPQPLQQYQTTVPPLWNTQQSINGIIKVNGRDSALQYQLPPNSMSPALFDNNGKVFYIVSTDGTGMKTIEAFDYLPHVDELPTHTDMSQYVSRSEFDSLAEKVATLIGAGNVHGPVQATTSGTDQPASDGSNSGS